MPCTCVCDAVVTTEKISHGCWVTKKEIMDAAYRVWGREFYLNTSLSHVARELKVCKPALYRHFLNKNALFETMTRYFFDDFAAFIQADYERALENMDTGDSIFILIKSVAEYYARNVNFFIFSMINLHDRRLDSFKMLEELCLRGVDIEYFHHSTRINYDFEPLVMRLVFATLTFYMAGFHKKRKSSCSGGLWQEVGPGETEISRIIDAIGIIIGKGLGYISEEIDTLDYQGLEDRITGTADNIEDDPLLKAVAGAVAEAGPWDASMEQVARRSGLSKSGLYSHFKSRRDMLFQLFMTESLRIIEYARQGMMQSTVPQEQIYLGVFSIAEYLRSKQDILVALDWIRNRRLDLGPPGNANQAAVHKNTEYRDLPIEFLRLFEGIDIKPLKSNENPFRNIFEQEKEDTVISPWILFLIVSTLMQRKPGQASPAMFGDVPNSDIRILYRFITLGIGGFRIQ
jgi:AcrR family transcriptional regulator